jgi:hypothetical protein
VVGRVYLTFHCALLPHLLEVDVVGDSYVVGRTFEYLILRP